jgi:hypothetical protein
MDHFNAMFEDATTKSWWQQATGAAVAGKLKGRTLKELASQQLTLNAWLRHYPKSFILQPDSGFAKEYKDLIDFDNGTIHGSLEKRDSASWHLKSWVIGVVHNKFSKAYDWNNLINKEIIEDSLPGIPVLLALENDSASFHVWSRNVNGKELHFEKNKRSNTLIDDNTHSLWNMNGKCITGPLKGEQMKTLQAYQEFWHSWKTFHPNTMIYD